MPATCACRCSSTTRVATRSCPDFAAEGRSSHATSAGHRRRHRALYRAMVIQQLRRAFGSDAAYAGHLIIITDQRQTVADLRGGDAEPLTDDVRRVASVLVGVVPPGRLGHELRE